MRRKRTKMTNRSADVWLRALLVAAAACGARGWTFLRGASTHAHEQEVAALAGAGANCARAYLLWQFAQPTLASFNASLSLADLRADPAGLVYAWADAELDWTETDRRLALLEAANLTVIGEAFEGTATGLPLHGGHPAGPGVLGPSAYLAYSYRYARAAVHRYKGRVHAWQIENELNEAWLEALGGVRYEASPLGPTQWGNWTFVTEALATLRAAVKDEDPSALVTTNLHSEVPAAVHRALGLPGFYLDAAANWSHLVDFVSLDAYPSAVVAEPRGAVVGQRVAALKGVLGASARVVVMETGYSVLDAPAGSQYASLNFSEARQARFVADAYASVLAAGGDGFLLFAVSAQAGQKPPGGVPYTQEDADGMAMVADVDEYLNVSAAIDWALGKHHLQEVPRLAQIVAGSADGFGVLRPDFSARPALAALARAFANSG